MGTEWRVAPWVAVRVAGLPAEVLSGLAVTRSAALLERLDKLQERHLILSSSCVDDLFEAVNGCQDVALRRFLLTLKRAVHGGRPIASMLATDPRAGQLPTAVRARLSDLATAESEVDIAIGEYESTYAQESNQVAATMRQRLLDADMLGHVMLSSPDLWNAVQWISHASPVERITARQQRHESALARYLFRAATRTSPFGGFAAVALVSWRRPPSGSHGAGWQSVTCLRVDALHRWVSRHLDPAAAARLPLSATRLGTPSLGPAARQVLDVAQNRSTDAVATMLARSAEERPVWTRLVDSLVGAGVLNRMLPKTAVDHSGLLFLARELEQLGDSRMAGEVRELAGLIKDYPEAPLADRERRLARLTDTLALERGSVPVYVDTSWSGLSREALGIDLEELRDIVRPALALARSALTDIPHQLLRDAFTDRFGRGGLCRDVAAFLTELSQHDQLVSRVRGLTAPPSWIDSPLGRRVAEAEHGPVQLEPALFDSLLAEDGPASFGVLVQAVPASPDEPTAFGRLVLNGIYSGRYKYLSRYLGAPDLTTRAALADVRAQLAQMEPLPVEITPVLGLNFQLHPRLTSWVLEVPGEPSPDPGRTLPLSDLLLSHDCQDDTLRLFSTRLEREVEPIHLGFLRDLNLPDDLLLLRALSPRIAEDTVSERVRMYDVLDRWEIFQGLPVRAYRPRLEVGRLVLERARWATPFAAVPLPERSEAPASFARRLDSWRRGTGLPRRGFVRRLVPGLAGAGAHVPPQYLDFHNPLSFHGLRRLVTDVHAGRLPDGWLLMSELLPRPEDATLSIAGRAHVSELLVHVDGHHANG